MSMMSRHFGNGMRSNNDKGFLRHRFLQPELKNHSYKIGLAIIRIIDCLYLLKSTQALVNIYSTFKENCYYCQSNAIVLVFRLFSKPVVDSKAIQAFQIPI